MKPYCFVLMPFGKKSDENGKVVHFDKVYNKIIKPAIIDANLKPIRADEEIFGGIIHKPMFERLMLCDYAIADLTTANANVLYELGIRHGIRPHSTILIFAEGMRLPFDVSPLRGLPYKLNKFGIPKSKKSTKQKIKEKLEACREPNDDSPLYQLVSDMPRPDISRLKTDTFRDSIKYSNTIKDKLRKARKKDSKAVSKVEAEFGDIVDVDPAILIDLFLSYRAVQDWKSMISLYRNMPPILKQTILVQEQLGFAYNRDKQHDEAEKILKDVIDKHGSSSETNGILGRVYKDLWRKYKKNNKTKAEAYLKKSIECYLEGFQADWRDAYPGINAVTLMEVLNTVDNRQKEILPVVEFAVNRRLDSKSPDYWDYATLLELNVLSGNKDKANSSLTNALTEVREKWEPKSTANNLMMIIEARKKRKEPFEWIEKICNDLLKASS